MATNLVLVLILIASIITAARSRSTLHLNDGFHRQISAAFNGHAIRLSQTGDSNGFNQQDSAPIPTGVGEGGFTTAETLVSSAKQQYILKVVVVVMILTLISSVTIVVLRTICNRYRSFGTDEENGPRSTETARFGQERPNSEENETLLNGIESVGPERPTYEPRPIPATVVNCQFIFSCNFPLCGALPT